MKYRPLGTTGIEISEIVFGAGMIGGIMIREDPETRLEAVRRALLLGINWFDTAPLYGDGRSEQNLGSALKELGASPHVSTKVRIGPDHLADVAGQVRRSLEASLERLQMDRVDLVILHSSVALERGLGRGPISLDDVLGESGFLEGFEAVRDGKMARFVGFSAGGDPRALRQMIASGRFHAAQVFHSLLNPSAGRRVPEGFPGGDYEELIGVAAAKGVGVLNIRVLAAGALVGSEVVAAHEPGATAGTDMAESLRHGATVRAALDGESGTIVQKAIRFALAVEGVSGVLVGFSRLEHIDEAVAAVEMGGLSTGAMRRLDALFASRFGDA